MFEKEIKKLQEDRAAVVKVQTDINDLAVKENRKLTEEEQTSWDAADVDYQKHTDGIAQFKADGEAEEKRQEEFEKRKEYLAANKDEGTVPDPNDDGETRDESDVIALPKEFRNMDSLVAYREMNPHLATRGYTGAFGAYLTGGMGGAHSVLNQEEIRALQADSDSDGGFLVVPEQFISTLIKQKDRMLFVRGKGTTFSVPNAASLGAPDLQADPADPIWTAEIRTGDEDSSMKFEKRELYPHPLAKRIKVSKKLIRVSRMNAVNIVRDRLAYKFRTVEENTFLNGNGSNQPLGVFTASNDGIPTGRDVSTGNTTTALAADNLINVKYSLEAQYRQTCSWAFHRDVVKYIRKLKDGEGNYLWKQGLTDRPDTILDLPYDESEYAPNTFTSGSYLGILGDWSFYWIADALNMQIQVLTELYAETNQNGYIGRAETDGMPVLPEAFARCTLA